MQVTTIKSCHHISKKLKIELRVLCYYFFQCCLLTPFLIFYTFLGCIFFCTELPFCPNFFLRILYFWVLLSMYILMLILVLLNVVPEALCASVLTCTVLVGQLNKIFGLITQTINILHGLYCMVFKNMCFWYDTKSKLAPGLHGGNKKNSFLSDPLTGWVNFP